MLALFYTQSQRLALERVTSPPEQAPPSLVWRMRLQLAWAQRQADPELALRLVDILGSEPLPAGISRRDAELATARSLLLKAEIRLLLGDADSARAGLLQARQQFAALEDAIGLADCHFLRFYIAADGGDGTEMWDSLTQALEAAKGDPERTTVFAATRARAAIFHEAMKLAATYDDELPQDISDLPAVESAAVADYLGMRAGMDGQYSQALSHLSLAHEHAIETGQQRRAITIATNLGHTYSRMGEFQTALEWLTRAIELSRRCAWPGLLSLCLAHLGEAQRRLGRHFAARATLSECLELCSRHPNGRTTALALEALGQTALDQGDAASAKDVFATLIDRSTQIRDAQDLLIQAHFGMARAMLAQSDHAGAYEHIRQGLELAQRARRPQDEVEALALLAEAARSERSHGSSRYTAADVVNLYMDALRQAERLPAGSPAPELFEASAQAIAECGGHERAYHLLERAVMELKRKQTSSNALARQALRLHHEIEQARSERAYLRTLAEAESIRSQNLASSLQVLHHLAGVGQAITHELDPHRIHDVLNFHCIELLGGPCSVLWMNEGGKGEKLTAVSANDVGIEAHGRGLELWRKCVQSGQSLFLDSSGQELEASEAQGLTFEVLSPLICAERTLGAIGFRCPGALPLDTQQLLIWRSLCGYTAVALDNALAQKRASLLQRELMTKERIQALSTLVASVAHELNTPIGNCRLVASTLQGRLSEVTSHLAQQSLKRADWVRYCQDLSQGLSLVERSMTRADSLIASFKQFALHTEQTAPQNFGLRTISDRVLQVMAGRLKEGGISWVNRIPQGLTLHGSPQALSQVLEILLDNAIKHAYPDSRTGLVVLSAERDQVSGCTRLHVTDSGQGIDSDAMHRIFEPFFSTKLGAGLNGLGLSVAYNLVQGLFGGQITVSSRPEHGCSFCIELPGRHTFQELAAQPSQEPSV
ncbi:tetratricopeptide repeat-containing sensor histidine kinase [Kinneretia asaccharophila]|uniref:histidine kinase n=1 Tax=Roseateles asaccharophilus TaxID=582607 RepID=A0A4R6MW08_9BURK|nr:ATP-binding protein [Roseateles asaccharophilus]MDN3545883.1 tetratricopeptide repeat-containing sensor histidine kinase [Roseateles asaccharophilus]TDP06662.1 tetratricopeptide repeat protein [Roseateles asaccharophilus]